MHSEIPPKSFEDDDDTAFDQFEENKRFGIQSTYSQSFYTTEYDEKNYTKEQLEKARKLEREIEEGKKNKKKQHSYEDEDENMDKVENSKHNLDSEYDEFVKNKQVFTMAEIEERQLSNTNIGQTKSSIVKEISHEDLVKQESMKSMDEFEIEGDGYSKNVYGDLVRETNSESSSDAQEATTPLNKNSTEFTPKSKGSEVSQSTNTSKLSTTGKTTALKSSLKSGSTAYIPGKLKSGSTSFVPSNKATNKSTIAAPGVSKFTPSMPQSSLSYSGMTAPTSMTQSYQQNINVSSGAPMGSSMRPQPGMGQSMMNQYQPTVRLLLLMNLKAIVSCFFLNNFDLINTLTKFLCC